MVTPWLLCFAVGVWIVAGCQGEQGEVGPRGEQGEQGEQGPQGARGEAGAPGADGRAGVDGRDGRDGADGAPALPGGGAGLSEVDLMVPPVGHRVEPPDLISWGPSYVVTAFFPGQANIQWVNGASHYNHPVAGPGSLPFHPGEGRDESCRYCHNGANGPLEKTLGERLLADEAGVEGKEAWKEIAVSAAIDETYLYLQATWESQRPRAGISHDMLRWRGGSWEQSSTAKTSEASEPSDLGEGEFFSAEDRIAVMMAKTGSGLRAFGDEGPTFDGAGCFIACHSSLRSMPEAPDTGEVEAHEYLGEAGLGQSDLRHYLLQTRHEAKRRDADAAWAAIDGSYDAAADRQAGAFLDLWQFRAARSAPMYGASNDYVMEYRHSGEGGVDYWFEQDPSTQAADAGELYYDVADHVWRNAAGEAIDMEDYAWMYDVGRTGFHALPADAVDPTSGELSAAWSMVSPLITQGPDRNAVPLDQAMIEEGDLLPRRPLRYGTDVRGRLAAFSIWRPLTNTWTVIFRRPLEGAASDLDLSGLLEGETLTLGFGVFDDHATKRYHFVSFPRTLGMGEGVHIRARDNRAF